jgi:hypothetical protein
MSAFHCLSSRAATAADVAAVAFKSTCCDEVCKAKQSKSHGLLVIRARQCFWVKALRTGPELPKKVWSAGVVERCTQKHNQQVAHCPRVRICTAQLMPVA